MQGGGLEFWMDEAVEIFSEFVKFLNSRIAFVDFGCIFMLSPERVGREYLAFILKGFPPC